MAGKNPRSHVGLINRLNLPEAVRRRRTQLLGWRNGSELKPLVGGESDDAGARITTGAIDARPGLRRAGAPYLSNADLRRPLGALGANLVAESCDQRLPHLRCLAAGKQPVLIEAVLQHTIRPARPHQSFCRMAGGSEQQVSEFMREGPSQKRTGVDTHARRDDLDSIGEYGREQSASRLHVDM